MLNSRLPNTSSASSSDQGQALSSGAQNQTAATHQYRIGSPVELQTIVTNNNDDDDSEDSRAEDHELNGLNGFTQGSHSDHITEPARPTATTEGLVHWRFGNPLPVPMESNAPALSLRFLPQSIVDVFKNHDSESIHGLLELMQKLDISELKFSSGNSSEFISIFDTSSTDILEPKEIQGSVAVVQASLGIYDPHCNTISLDGNQIAYRIIASIPSKTLTALSRLEKDLAQTIEKVDRMSVSMDNPVTKQMGFVLIRFGLVALLYFGGTLEVFGYDVDVVFGVTFTYAILVVNNIRSMSSVYDVGPSSYIYSAIGRTLNVSPMTLDFPLNMTILFLACVDCVMAVLLVIGLGLLMLALFVAFCPIQVVMWFFDLDCNFQSRGSVASI
jgi:hypothetical protein